MAEGFDGFGEWLSELPQANSVRLVADTKRYFIVFIKQIRFTAELEALKRLLLLLLILLIGRSKRTSRLRAVVSGAAKGFSIEGDGCRAASEGIFAGTVHHTVGVSHDRIGYATYSTSQ